MDANHATVVEAANTVLSSECRLSDYSMTQPEA
jgi:hypothetical protein